MSVYKIFPEKSATLYSFYPALNTGLDEILEISTYESINGTNESSRALIQFPSDEINSILNLIGTGSYDAFLKLYLANSSHLPLNYSLYCHPVASDWNVGTGRLSNVPSTVDGVSWVYEDQYLGNKWPTSIGSYALGTTASFDISKGGGTWWTSSLYQSTQSFDKVSSKDISLKVTETVDVWHNTLTNPFAPIKINNYGFIVKHNPSIEFSTSSKVELKYFSENTHTIYPPCLEIRWDDSHYITGSLPVMITSLFVASLGNNKGEYQQDSVQRFRVNVRHTYPARTFQTSSIYLTNHALPKTSYWSIKDLDTEEIVIDYDTNYTKISCDTNGSYFDVYMNGLEPERYYKLLIKTVLPDNEQVIISDSNYYFKVIR
jgi:hypothetical protein